MGHVSHVELRSFLGKFDMLSKANGSADIEVVEVTPPKLHSQLCGELLRKPWVV